MMLADRELFENASCAQITVEEADYLFFPSSKHEMEYKTARMLCSICPVLIECRDWCDAVEGVESDERPIGMFAGESPRQRLARRRRALSEIKEQAS